VTRRGLIRLLGGLALLVVALLLGRRLAADWRGLPAGALADFHLDPAPLVVAWLIQTGGWLLLVDTWRHILGPDATHVPFTRHLQLVAYTRLTFVIPGSLWAPASRLALYRQQGVPALAVGAAVLTEWVLLGLAGLLVFGLTAPFARALRTEVLSPIGVLAMVASVVAAAGLLHPAVFGRTVGWVARRMGVNARLQPVPARRLAGWFGRELVVLVLAGVGLYLLMRAVSPGASLIYALCASSLALAVANLLAWLPATALLKDGSMVLLLTPFYGSALLALGVVVIWRIWLVLAELSWAVLATLAARRLPPPRGDRPEGAWTG
jgi:uncharacterized membrane protein YbhN (UPF0104 family)